jgi:hypothetical protein
MNCVATYTEGKHPTPDVNKYLVLKVSFFQYRLRTGKKWKPHSTL